MEEILSLRNEFPSYILYEAIGNKFPIAFGNNPVGIIYEVKRDMPRLLCHYHAVWATKHRAPVITPALETIIFATIRKTASDLKCPIHALNGWVDHVHIALEIHHTLSISDWMKRVKGASARAVNVQMPDLETPFYWQIGYSVQTFSLERLAGIVSYIEKQKTHHQDQTLLSAFESLDDTEG